MPTAVAAGPMTHDEQAYDTGGAMFVDAIVAGNISNCNFVDNHGPTGGAVSLARTADRRLVMAGSSFVGNSADAGAGGAIVQEGRVRLLSVQVDDDVIFQANAAQCCYAGGNMTGIHGLCMDASTGYGTGWQCCYAQQYLGTDSNGNATCITCNSDLDCTTVGTTVLTLPLAAGHWRESPDQEKIRECWHPHACNGTVALSAAAVPWSADMYCADGYQGPYCAVCAEHYAALPGYQCVRCSETATATAYTMLALAAMVLATLVWVLISTAITSNNGVDGVATAGAAMSALQLAHFLHLLVRQLRTPIIVWQILTQYVSITGLALPLQYLDFLRGIDFLTFDLRWLTSPGCAMNVNFYERLLLSTVVPLIVCGIIFIPRGCLRYRTRAGRTFNGAQLRTLVEKDLNTLLVFTFLIFSGVSLTVLQTFSCDDFPLIGKSYLRADYSIQCNTPKHTAYQVYAGVMVLVYPLGIPALFAWVLIYSFGWRRDEARSAAADQFSRSATFLWAPYTAHAHYWECIECLHRLMLAGMLVFIPPDTAALGAVACLFAFVMAVVYEQVTPHQETREKRLYTLGYSIVFVSMFTSQLMQYKHVGDTSEQVIGGLLIALNVLLLTMALAQVALAYSGSDAGGLFRQTASHAVLLACCCHWQAKQHTDLKTEHNGVEH
ncbi:hypothetical protein JKP88DRAFT_254102 [Tribonema minus]|uniref:TRP C-terminal domain-containing protein n=1 Tax=Tribonema minus TaxID=303371 RepID=A0A836CIF1_9STRA|nr:hypothetical protein JKP88DRAFT_254102 [Tribonema minus]